MLALVTVSLLLLGVRILPCCGKSKLRSLDVGKDVAWAIGLDNALYYRNSIEAGNPHGLAWFDGFENAGYEDVTVSPNGYVWAVRTNKRVYFRTGITNTTKGGTGWKRAGDGMKRLSAGASGLWGVDETGQVSYLVGTYGDTGASGASWVKVPNLGAIGKVKHISAGDGFALAVNEEGTVWKRGRVSPENNDGGRWDQVAEHMREVDTWDCYVWGISDGGNVKRARLDTES